MNTFIGITLIILSAASFVAIVGAYGIKFFIQRENNKIEVTSSDKDNFNN